MAGLLAMVLAVVAGPRFISWLRSRDIGQTIRDEGPEHHSVKQGTPTMGGLLILSAAAVPYILFADKTVPSMMVFLLTFGSGAIGLMDDLAKVRQHRSLGLTARNKLLLQAALILVVGWFAVRFAGVEPGIRFPVFDRTISLGIYYPLFAFLLIAGFSNAVNLTD